MTDKHTLFKSFIIGIFALLIIFPVMQSAQETLCFTERVTGEPSFNIYTGRDDPNNPIIWSHNVPAGILDSVVRVGLYIEAYDVDYPANTEHDRVYFNGYDLGILEGVNNTWITVEKTVPVAALREGVNELKVYVDELATDWKVTIRASELRFYCSGEVPDFSIGITPAAQEILQGESTEFLTTLTGLNGFESPVNLSVSGLPAGVSGVFSLNPATPSPTAESTLTVTADATAEAGTYTLTITGQSGETVHTDTVTLIIKKKEAEENFIVEAEPMSRTVVQGASAGYIINVAADEVYSKKVTLSVTGLPEGTTAEFSPKKVKPTGQSDLEIFTTEQTPVGTYKLTVKGTADRTRKVEITLKVEEKPPAPDFTLEATPTTHTVVRGTAADYTLKLTALNGFADEVKLSTSLLPAGVTALLTPETLTPDGDSILNIATTADAAPGSYTFNVTAVSGSITHEVTLTLDITCPPFTVTANGDPLQGPGPLTVKFTGNLDNGGAFPLTDYTFNWNLGDGGSSTEQNPEHTYGAPGLYKAVLTVTDPCGETKTASVDVEVESFSGTLTKSFSTTHAQPGDEVIITIITRNTTRMDFKDATLIDELSPYLLYVSDDAPVSPRQNGQKLQWDFTKLEKGQTITVKIKTRVAENTPPGTITNIAYLSHGSLDKDLASNRATLTVDKIDASVVKTVDKQTAKPQDTLTYRIRVKNNSSLPLTGIELTDELSPDLEFVSQSGGLDFTRQGRSLKWTGTVEAGQEAEVTVEARTAFHVISNTVIENMAKLEAAELRETLESNRVATTISAEPTATSKVRFTKRAEIPQAEVGRIIRFTLTVANRSGSTLLTPIIEDHLPQGFAYVASSTTVNGQRFEDPQGKRVLMWNLPYIKPFETVVLRYQLVIGADARRGRNTNRATLRTVDNSGQDLFYEASAFVNVSAAGFIFYSGVEGTVYLDRDGDEFYSMTDTPLEGIEVRMSSGEKAITNAMGHYMFEGLFPGEYAVAVNSATLPEKYKSINSYSQPVVLTDGLTDTVDFAIRFQGEDIENSARLQGRVFFDKNHNGLYDAGEPLVDTFTAVLDGVIGTKGQGGSFVFTHQPPGPHSVEIRYGPRKLTQEIVLEKGKQTIDIPLPYSAITIIISGEGK